MNRRMFLALTAATTGALSLPTFAQSAPLEYRPGLVKERLAAGDTVFLDFKADWCGTCAAQERVLNNLKSQNPDYDARITFINVDWDEYARSDLTSELNIPRRSTLVVLKGDQELGRIIAQTSTSSIKTLLDTALAAASA